MQTFRSAVVRLRVLATFAGFLACASLGPGVAAAQNSQPTVNLSGRVTDAAGRGIANAEILIAGMDGTVRADANGSFRISGVDAGARTITARRLGYAPATRTAMLVAGDRTVDLTLVAFPYRLAAVNVKAGMRPRHFDPHMDEFRRRRARAAGGTFITRSEIEKLQARQMTDLFRLAPGFRASRDRLGGLRASTRGNSSSCRMRFFLDGLGAEMIENNLDMMVRIQDVEAVEFYRGASTAPAEFSGVDRRGDAGCGVIVVWTRQK